MHSAERWPIVLCGFLCLQVSSVFAGLERRCTSATYEAGTHQQGLCGSRLSDTVGLVCGGLSNVNILDSNKRSSPSHRYRGYHRYKKRDVSAVENKDSEKIITKEKRQKIFLEKRDAMSYLISKRSAIYEQGIVCECCYNGCSYYELTQYCITPPMGFFKKKRSLPRPKNKD